MNPMKSIFLAAIASTTVIALTAIYLDHVGAIDMSFGGDWFQIKIESGEKRLHQTGTSEKRLPQTGNVSDDTL